MSEDLKKLAETILSQGYLMSLGTQDENGVWVSDVIYLTDEQCNLFWLSDPDVRHSQAIQKNPQVAGTITISNKQGEENIGLQFTGRAKQLPGTNLELAIKHRQKRNKLVPTRDGEVEDGDAWYKLTPTKIQIINEPLWGYEKKTYTPGSPQN